jgi:prepilin-type processing-associated H-X9-DG protein
MRGSTSFVQKFRRNVVWVDGHETNLMVNDVSPKRPKILIYYTVCIQKTIYTSHPVTLIIQDNQ